MNPIIFPVTYKCNLNCVYCNVKNSRQEPNIDICLDLINKSDNNWVFITGGEPLLRNDIIDICKNIKSFGKKIGLTTNGTTNNYEILKYIDRIGVSLDGDKEVTDKNRGDGVFEMALNYLKNCSNIETVIMATIVKPLNDIEITKIAEKLNVDYLQVTLI